MIRRKSNAYLPEDENEENQQREEGGNIVHGSQHHNLAMERRQCPRLTE